MSCFLTYNLSVTGDCGNNNLGAFDLYVTGSAPTFTVTWINPSGGTTTALPTPPYLYSVSGLSAGTYSLQITDSCVSPGLNTIYSNIYISSGTSVNILNVNNTTCNLNNGSLTASTEYLYGTASFKLFDLSDTLIYSAEVFDNTYVFTNLSASTYYVIADDGGGCTGRSETVIVQNSSNMSFGLYTINNAGCSLNSGAVYVSGLTGTPPYTYLWSNSQTTSYITGLTEGVYSVTITDGSGCQMTNSVMLYDVPNVGINNYVLVSPTCLTPDGELTVYLTGGTAPYYYLCSNGDSSISFSNNHTFTGLSAGFYNVNVTDAGLCNASLDVNIYSPNSFEISSVTTKNSVCNNNDGELTVSLFASTGLFTYQLSGNNTNQLITTSTSSYTFAGLSSGAYDLTVSSSELSTCFFTNTYVINNTSKFEISAITTGTTCSLTNGSVKISIGTGATAPYTISINGIGKFVTNNSETILSSLSSGSYILNVTDYDLCKQIIPFVIGQSNDVDFALVEDNQTLSAVILQGTPPYTLNWSPNVNGQTGSTVSNLSAGTYSLTVIDSSGCAKTRTQQLTGSININTYQTYSISNSRFEDNSIIGTKGPKDMLLEGFTDLASNDTNCVLNESIFIAEVTFDGLTTTQPFYTGYTLNEYPSKQQWINVVSNILSGYTGITKIEFNLSTNQFNLETVCEGADYNNVLTTINLIINYDISCEELGVKIHFQNRDDFDFMNDDPFWFQ